MALTCKVCEMAGVNCICKPTLIKRVIMQLQHSQDKDHLGDVLHGMQTIPGYIAGIIVEMPDGINFTLQLLFDIQITGETLQKGQRFVYINTADFTKI